MSFKDAKEISFNDEKEISLKEISFSMFFEDAKEISFNDEKETTSVDLVPDVVSATRTRPQSGTPGPGSLSQWFTSASVRRSSSVRSRVDLLPLLRRDLELLLGPGPLGMGRERLIPADLLGVLRLERLRTSGRSNERALKIEASTNVERSPEFLASSPLPHVTCTSSHFEYLRLFPNGPFPIGPAPAAPARARASRRPSAASPPRPMAALGRHAVFSSRSRGVRLSARRLEPPPLHRALGTARLSRSRTMAWLYRERA